MIVITILVSSVIMQITLVVLLIIYILSSVYWTEISITD